MSDFYFDPTTVRYRDRRTGQLVGFEAIKALSRQAVVRGVNKGVSITDQLLSGEFDLGEWERQIAESLKLLHLQQYKLSVGNMTQRDYGIIGNRLRVEYRYLRNFALEIAAGMLSEAQIRQRIALYYNATYLSFERGRREAFSRAGARWERRILNSKVPCAQCPQYASLGWSPAGFLPNIGVECDCRSNCKCSFEYAFGTFAPGNQSILNQSFGWLNHGFNTKFN